VAILGVRCTAAHLCLQYVYHFELRHQLAANFTVYQDRLKTNLLQLFAQPENAEWFSIISFII